MATGQLNTVVHYLHHIAAARTARALPDGELLESFITEQDAAAFEVLVDRHGPMVLGLCQRVLRNREDAEDAFQATFLVLFRKASAIHKRASVSSWLYGVAYRTAVRARDRRTRDRALPAQLTTEARLDPAWDDLACVLDEELSRLPEKYRLPVILCYQRGATYEEAARELGCPKGTVAIRLARARERLRVSLTRRGVTLSIVVLATAVARQATAAVTADLIRATLDAARAAQGTAVAVSPAVLALTRAGFETLPMSKFTIAGILVMALGVVALGPGLLIREHLWSSPLEAQAAKDPAAAPNLVKAPQTDKGKEAGPPAPRTPAQVARRLWAIMDLVLADHFNPCTRKTMIEASAAVLLHQPPDKLLANDHQLLAEIRTAEQFEKFVQTNWPNADQTKQPAGDVETALVQALLTAIPGEPELMPAATVKITEQVGANRYIGIGIQLTINKDEQLPQITNPMRKGIAWKAGVKPNDLLLEVDGKSTHNVKLVKIVDWLRGEEGTPVTIVVRQPKAATTRTFKLIRGVNPFDSTLGYRRGSGDDWIYRADPSLPIAYVWVSSIRISTLHELRQLERQWTAEGIRALVLDFRFSNGDGMMSSATLLADGLLDAGLMWRVRNAHNDVRDFLSDRECLFRNWPVAALINGAIRDRAQGAVLAALQDQQRATLVGEATKTDGYVNRMIELPGEGDALIIRTGCLERSVKGRSWPVQPDQVVTMTQKQQEALFKWLRQKELPELPAGTTDQPPEDPQLARAVAFLRDALHTQGSNGEKGK